MPEVLTIESQVPENLELSLSWGEISETPPQSDLVRLAPGEEFTIPKGHATSIRAKDGWHKGYALIDTLVTGPVDISVPTAMTRREFAPLDTSNTPSGTFAGMLILAGIGFGTLSLVVGVAKFGMIAQLGALVVGSMLGVTILRLFLKIVRSQDEKYNFDACAETSNKTFWREDLEWIQSQPIRVETSGN